MVRKKVKISRKKQAEKRKNIHRKENFNAFINDQEHYLDDKDNADKEDDKINGGSYADDDNDSKINIKKETSGKTEKIYIERKALMRIIYDQEHYLDDEDNADAEDDKINGGSYAGEDDDSNDGKD